MNPLLYHILRQLTVISLLLISACAGKPTQPTPENQWLQRQQQITVIDQWTVNGRMGIKTPEQRNSFNFNWQHQIDKQQFMLYELGITYAKLYQEKDKALLELSDDQQYQSSDVETLMSRVLGYPIPIEHMRYWIMGLPYPGNSSALTFDQLGYLKEIKYHQWRILYKKYRRYDNYFDIYLPSKITITDGEVTIKLSLRDWQKDTEL